MSSRNVLKPAMLLGLGERGVEAASECYRFVKEVNPLVSKIVSGIGITSSGRMFRLSDDSTLLTIENLADVEHPNPYECNYGEFVSREEDISDILASHFEALTGIRFYQELEEAGYEIKTENVQVFVFAPSFDLLGSATTIPLLGILEVMKKNRRIPKNSQVSLFVLLADLSGTSDARLKRIELARTFQFLSELDYELGMNLVSQSDAMFDVGLTWLLSGKNEDNSQVGTFAEVLSVVTNTVESMIAYPVLGDLSFRHILLTKLQQRGRFYSSFGSSRIIFPEKEIIDLLCSYAVAELLKPMVTDLEEGQFDRSLVFEGCREFLAAQHITSITDLLSKEEKGNAIYQGFSHPIPKDDSIIPNLFYADVENKFKLFSERTLNDYIEKLSTQSQAVLHAKEQALENTISVDVDTEKRGLGYSVAVLRSLQGQDSRYLRGDSLEMNHTIDEVEKTVRSFYKVLLGLDVKEGSLDKLDAQIKAKDRRIGECEKELVRVSKLLERAESPADIEKLKLDQAKLLENSKVIAFERTKLVDEFEDLKSEIARLNLHIDDLHERMILKEEEERKSEEEVQEARLNVDKADKALKEAQIHLKALAELRRRIFWMLAATIPACVTAIILLTGISLSYFGILDFAKFLGFFLDNWTICLGSIVVYAIVSFLYFERKVGREFRQTKLLVQDLRSRKKSNMVQLVDAFNSKALVRWRHLVHNEALMWAKSFRDRLFEITENIEGFIKALQSTQLAALNLWATKNLPNTLSKKSVLTKSELVDTFYTKSPPSLEKHFRKVPLSSYVIKHLHQETDGSLEDALKQFVAEEFASIRSKCVEDFIFPEGPAKRTVTSVYVDSKIRSLFRSAAPLCHLDVVADVEKAEQKVAICVQDKEKSQVPELVEKLFSRKKEDFYSTGDKNVLEIDRFTIGFPLFQVSQLKSAQSCHKDLCENDAKRAYSIEKIRYQGYSPYPEALIDHDIVDQKRRLIFEAELFGFLKRDERRRFVLPNDPAPMDENELIKFLESFRGRTVKRNLEESTNKAKYEKPKECVARALRFLAQEGEDKASQLTEMMMAKKLLEELDPLA
ncbi:MAG: hypothetical protein NTU47_02275 [Ignavibacteriales bacterium]|nr:hypothetical protein [Ignavibacteriales bacterium]